MLFYESVERYQSQDVIMGDYTLQFDSPPLDNMASITQTTFQMHFRERKSLYFESTITDVGSWRFDEQYSSTGSDEGLGGTGDKPLSVPMQTQFTDTSMGH